MSKKDTKNPENLPTLAETLAGNGLTLVSENGANGEHAETIALPSWVKQDDVVMLPPNLIEQLVAAHRERDAAYAIYQQHEHRRGGLFDGFLFAMGLPVTTTYDLATGLATVPKAD